MLLVYISIPILVVAAARKPSLKWIIDITIGYPEGKPIDMFAIAFGHRPPCTTKILYRLYPVNEVPHDETQLLHWMYRRFEEKERLLDHFYTTGDFPKLDQETSHGHLLKGDKVTELSLPTVALVNLFGLVTSYYFYSLVWSVLAIMWSLFFWW